MKSVTAAEMRAIEKEAFERYGLTPLILMENAGRSIAEIAEREFRLRKKKVLAVCGPGNNGGDGFTAARHLHNRGIEVSVALLGKEGRLTPETAFNLNVVRRMGLRYLPEPGLKQMAAELAAADLVLDALFGTGLSRDLAEPYLGAIEAMNGCGKAVVSVDVPSGMDADTGGPRPVMVLPKLTVTLGFPKRGLAAAGARFVVADISLPRAAGGGKK